MRRGILKLALGAACLLAVPSFGQEAESAGAAPAERSAPEASSLDELLELVRKGWQEERAEDRRREEEFRRAKADQERLLAEAKATQEREEQRSQVLELEFQENEKTLATLEETLAERLGSLGELFGVVRQVSGDAAGQVESSLVSAQIPGRAEFLTELGKSKSLPSIESLEKLWFEIQREMTEQGKVLRFEAPVLTAAGEQQRKQVIRAGWFNAIADGQYLYWDSEIQQLRELDSQPPSRFLSTVADYENTREGFAPLAVDPSGGQLLAVLIQTRTLMEYVPEGGPIGYTIIGLGVFAALLAIVRWLIVTVTGRKVAVQQKSDTPNPGNPLGRVMAVYDDNQDADPETLELRLDEAVMQETARLERFIWLVKVVSVVAPLLGLLGTVTGMISTFQSITLFGAGDPKMMASGISEALVTTMLGLFTAIPLVLLHALLSNSAKRITDVLDEQSSGLIAQRMERAGA